MSNSGDSKHTPGPWFDRPDHDPVLIQGASEVGLSIAFACGGGDHRRSEYVANARLIAAAPDMLEALARIVQADYEQPTKTTLCYRCDEESKMIPERITP